MVYAHSLSAQYCILPLGSQSVHETQPEHVKSVFLAGPSGVGKSTLVGAIAHELGVSSIGRVVVQAFTDISGKPL